MAVTSTPTGNPDTFLGDSGAERIYDNVQATLPGAVALPLVQMQLWNAITDFALRSTWYRDELPWTMGEGQQSYDFNPYDSNMTVCWILGQHGLYNWRVMIPATLVDLTCGTLPSRSGYAMVALRPLRLDSNLPSDLFDQWFEGILSGTIGRLYMLPAKPWSDGKAGLLHMHNFNAKIGEARAIARQRYGNIATWHFPYFASGRR